MRQDYEEDGFMRRGRAQETGMRLANERSTACNNVTGYSQSYSCSVRFKESLFLAFSKLACILTASYLAFTAPCTAATLLQVLTVEVWVH